MEPSIPSTEAQTAARLMGLTYVLAFLWKGTISNDFSEERAVFSCPHCTADCRTVEPPLHVGMDFKATCQRCQTKMMVRISEEGHLEKYIAFADKVFGKKTTKLSTNV